ncbi:DNA polymerase subunit Cdc27 [Trichoderma barbatum]
MDDAKKYLSDRLLSEEVPVTYRLLSRVLNIRVNAAKQKLYEFYQSQNASKANSIHATYLIYGSKTEDRQPESGDTDMDGSAPEPEPLSDYAPTKTVTIVAEENLKDVLAEYDEITSFHIYSLAPFPQRDLALLSDVSKSLSDYRKIEDAAKTMDTYGIIANPQARKKDRKGRLPVPASSAPKSVKQEAQPTLPKPSQPEKVKQETKEAPSAESTPSSSAAKKPPATLKRGASGGIMQSFAKAAAKPSKPKPKPEPKAKEEDTSMVLSDDGEADDEDLPTSKSVDLEALKRTRKQREEELMRMMEDADDEIKVEAKKEEEQSDEEMEEASEAEPEPEPEPEPEQQPKEEKEPTEVISNSGNGRRRGKRRVMKKKRILDEQGYMVTIQEAAWESFSEDEAPPPAATKPTPVSTPASSTQKSKKAAAGKSGSQGSIMSFFAKK